VAAPPKSNSTSLCLSLGDLNTSPTASIKWMVQTKKAVTPKNGKTMKEMSIAGFSRKERASNGIESSQLQRQQQQQQQSQRQHQRGSQFLQGSNAREALQMIAEDDAQGGPFFGLDGDSVQRPLSGRRLDDYLQARDLQQHYDDKLIQSQSEFVNPRSNQLQPESRFRSQPNPSQPTHTTYYPPVDAMKLGETMAGMLQKEGRGFAGSQPGEPVDRRVEKTRQETYLRSNFLEEEEEEEAVVGEGSSSVPRVFDRNVVEPFDPRGYKDQQTTSTTAYGYGDAIIPVGDYEIDGRIPNLPENQGGMQILMFIELVKVNCVSLHSLAFATELFKL
jgi:hypothetical protein